MTALLLAASLAFTIPAQADSFPHGAHRRLFTSCTTCHAGIVNGDSSTARPAAATCSACHDGTLARRVEWTSAPPRPTNLRFDHRSHVREVARTGDSALTCSACHTMPQAAAFMDAGPAKPAACLSCHAHRAPQHLAAEANCSSCHRTLGQATRLAAADIARFSKPPSHDSGYVFRHGREATATTCAVCHTRESCSSCHVNAGRVAAITALATDERMASLARVRASGDYPEPASHEARDFGTTHGQLAMQQGATCASCHARESCLGCHRSAERLAAVNDLPRRTRGVAPGVELAMSRPASHGAGFQVSHRTPASEGAASCGNCHAQSYCATCHDGSSSPAFHGANYVSRHSAESFGSAAECSSCHQPQAFCASCHVETGRARTGAIAGKYHDAQPTWSFAHGAVARRSLETCVACHQQSDCLQCHSSSRGWGVNPHGPGFNPAIESKNPAMCRVCHTGGPPRS